jgi:hypothetical protein
MKTDSRWHPVIRGLALALLVAVGSIVLHTFSRTVGRAPALAFDDALAGISANLSREGRLGFDAIPVHTLAMVSQNEHFFNYGPWYFFLGASLDWLFGTSYEVHRWAHPIGLMLSVLFASLFFRESDRWFATAIYGCGALLSFQYHQWPMVRPDILGSVGASLALVFARSMVTRAGFWPVFRFGLSVGIAVTNHPIVAALVPWSLLVLLAAAILKDPPREGSLKALVLPWILGLLAAGLGLVAASGFRLGSILNLYFLYPSFVNRVGGGATIGFVESIDRHLNYVGLSPGAAQGLAALALVVVLIDGLVFVRRRNPSAMTTLLPGSAWAAYLLSLGIFRNTHEGYVILVQLLFLWTATAWIVRLSRGLSMVAGLAIPAAALMVVTSTPGRWEQNAAISVPYREYIDAVRADIPEAARVQGEAIFGLGRPNWVEMAHAALLTRRFMARHRERMAPDFLVISEKEWEMECLQAQSLAEPRLLVPDEPWPNPAPGGFFNRVPWLFRESSFPLARIVWAPPYRSTGIYRREAPDTVPPPRPEVAVWSPEGLWQRRAEQRGIPFEAGEGIVVSLRGSNASKKGVQASSDSWTADLDGGVYLIEAAGAKPARVGGCLVASPSRSIETVGSLLATTPRLPKGLVTYQVVRHAGGPLHIGLLTLDVAEGDRLTGVTAYRVAPEKLPSGDQNPAETYPAMLLRCRNGNGPECATERP